MKNWIVGILLVCSSNAFSQGATTKVRTLYADSVGIRSSASMKGLLRSDGTNLLLSSPTGIVQFNTETGFGANVQFNLPRTTLATYPTVGASEAPFMWVTNPAITGQNIQFQDGVTPGRKTPLYIGVGVNTTDGGTLFWEPVGDTLKILPVGAANRLYGMNAAGTVPEYKAATVTSAGEGTFQALTSSQNTNVLGELRLGNATVADGIIRLYSDANAFSAVISPPGVGYSANKTLYYVDFTQNTDTISTREWVRTTNSSLPLVVDFTTKTGFRIPSANNPPVSTVGAIALNTNAVGPAAHGDLTFYNGLAQVNVVGTLSSDVDESGDIPYRHASNYYQTTSRLNFDEVNGMRVDDSVDTYFLQPLSEGVQHEFQAGAFLVGGLANQKIKSIPIDRGYIGVMDSVGTPKMFSPKAGLILYEDWISTTEVGQCGWTEFKLNGTADALISNSNGGAGHFGIAQLTTGNASEGTAVLHLGATTSTAGFFFAVNGGTTVWEADVAIQTLSTVGEAYDLFLGFSDDEDDVDYPLNGVYFQYNNNASAFWYIGSDSAGNRSPTVTTATVATGWTKLRIEISTVTNGYAGGGEARLMADYFVNDVNVGSRRFVPILPVAPLMMIVKQAGTAARTVALDYVSISHFFATER